MVSIESDCADAMQTSQETREEAGECWAGMKAPKIRNVKSKVQP